MEFSLIGLSHRTAPIELRERIAFAADEMAAAIGALKDLPDVEEALLLSTCNRTEVLVCGKAGASIGHRVIDFLCDTKKLTKDELTPALYRYSAKDATRHLFRVASSLDSLVIGEPQILGQVKDAYHLACEAKGCGPLFNRLFHRTFQVAKRVRNETRIAENAVSVSYAGVELAKRIFGDLSGKAALLVGAGEMAELAVQHLLTAGLGKISIANRTQARAANLASQFGGYAIAWEQIDDELVTTDIVITSAAAPHYLVRKDRLEKVMRARKYRPLFFVDLGLPRNVDPAVGQVEACYVYDIDDLESVVEENKKARYAEAKKAEDLVEEETEKFLAYLNSLHVVPTIVALQNRIEDIRLKELEKALSQLAGLSEQDRERIEYLTRAITKKILHTPITALKEAERAGNGDDVTQVTRKLFGIEEEAQDALRAHLSEVKKTEESGG